MKQVEFLIGIPGSGKSHYAKGQIHSNVWHAKVARVNKDDLRKLHPDLKEKQIVKMADERLQELMVIGYEKIIVDNTHLNPVHEERTRKIAEQHGYEFTIKWFDDSLDPDLCHKRNIAREDTVPFEVIETMYEQYFKRWMEREGYALNPCRWDRKTVIVDLDGTVAHNDGHRGWYDWGKVGADKPHHDIIELVNMLAKSHDVVFMSGRDEVCYAETRQWIEDQFGSELVFELYMREEGDMRKDSFVKFDLFMEWVNAFHNVAYVLDDRHQVVRMWRAMGLRCLQVANGWK